MTSVPSKMLILGAGASYGSRPTCQPPLGQNLAEWLLEKAKMLKSNSVHCPRSSNLEEANINDSIINLFQSKKLTNYEDIISCLWRNDDLINLYDVNKFISFCFSSPNKGLIPEFENKEDEYDTLADFISADYHAWGVISLNYDCLFEKALKRKRIPYHQSRGCELNHSNKSVCFVKPHGSINWFSSSYMQPGQTHNMFEIGSNNLLSTNSMHVEYLECNQIIAHLLNDHYSYPVMAHFSNEKYPDHDPCHLEKVRDYALRMPNMCTEAYVIGVKPPKDGQDTILDKILQSLNKEDKKVSFINPDEQDQQVCKIYYRYFEGIPEKMEQWLKKTKISIT